MMRKGHLCPRTTFPGAECQLNNEMEKYMKKNDENSDKKKDAVNQGEESNSGARIAIVRSLTPRERLTKTMRLGPDGKIEKISGGSLTEGSVRVHRVRNLAEFAAVLSSLTESQAHTYGIPAKDTMMVVTKRKLAKLRYPVGWTARTNEYFVFAPGMGILFIDYDPPKNGRALTREELLAAIGNVIPDVFDAGYVWWPSSSSHIYNGDTDLTGLRGQRLYLLVADGTDISRAGKILHERLWLAGHGRFDISGCGSLLNRSPVDASVWQGARLDFASGACCETPLEQKRGEPFVVNGKIPSLDTRKVFKDLKPAELKKLKELQREAKVKLQPEADRVRAQWLEARIAKEAGPDATPEQRTKVKARLISALDTEMLGPDFELTVFLEDGATTVKVSDILADPDTYDGARCLDPLEPEYDASGPAVLLVSSGGVVLHSYAHGGKTYTLAASEEAIALQNPYRLEKYGVELHPLSMKGGQVIWYWRQKSGGYVPGTTADTRLALLTQTTLSHQEGRSGQPLVDEIMQRLRLEQSLAYAGVFPGYDAGIHLQDGRRILSVRGPIVPEMDPSCDGSILTETIHTIFPDADCCLRFEAWLFGAWEMLHERRWEPHPALALVGPVNSGKSLLMALIRWILGNYSAGKAVKFLRGETSFNADLCESVMLEMDDEIPPAGQTAREALGQKIKGIVTCVPQRIEAKGLDAVTLKPHWRIIIATNEEPEKVTVLPPIDDSTEDKILILRCAKGNLPGGNCTRDERMSMLQQAVPGWLAQQNARRVDFEGLGDSRCKYVGGWQEPGIRAILDAFEPEAKLLSLIDLLTTGFGAIMSSSNPVWRGGSVDLEAILNSHEKTRQVAHQLFTWRSACGTYLERLSKRRPDRVRRAKPIRSRDWEIKLAGFKWPEQPVDETGDDDGQLIV